MTLTATPPLVAFFRRLAYCRLGHEWIRDRLATGALALVCVHCLTAVPIEWGNACRTTHRPQ